MVSMCQRARQGKLPVGFYTDANSQFCQPKVRFYEELKRKLVILFLQQFSGIRYAVSTPMLKTGQSAVGLKSCL